MTATPAQIAHIKQHQQAFDEMHGHHRDVEEYFQEYAYVDGLYESVCSDLEISPITKSLTALGGDGDKEPEKA